MSSRPTEEYYTVWRRVGARWAPLRTYLILQQAMDLAKDWSIDGHQYRVTKSRGQEVARFGKQPRQPRVPSPSAN